MKKSSKASSKRTRRSRSRSPEAKSKVLKSRSKSKEREATKEVKDKTSRKSRWQSEATTEDTTQVTVAVEGAPRLRIRDLLDDKEKLMEYLFLTVTETALEELIPDYLKKCSVEELKKLCSEQIKDMSRECIMSVISEPQSEKSPDAKPLVVSGLPSHVDSPSLSETPSEDVLELNATDSEIKGVITDEENRTPTPTEEEESEDLPLPESDADLLELEMRARAIRSLLKARTQETEDSDMNE